jgi:nucleoside diphosphate kinase
LYIKPDAIDHEDHICKAIEEAGFTLVRKTRQKLSKQRASELYINRHNARLPTPTPRTTGSGAAPVEIPADEMLKIQTQAAFLSCGPIAILMLESEDETVWEKLVGVIGSDDPEVWPTEPSSLRALYASDKMRKYALRL